MDSKIIAIESFDMDHIPESVLLEVLFRLPVKVVFKFKIVSKQWLSIISDPCFARMYVSLSPHSQDWTLLNISVDEAKHFHVIKVPRHECSLGTNCMQQRLIFPHARLQSDDLDYRIVGVSNGLVLYDVVGPDRIYFFWICNLITGQRITLPPYECGHSEVVEMGFVTRVEDNALASFRVVLLDSPHTGRVFKFAVYSSETRRWEDFDVDFCQDAYICTWKKSAVVGNIVHSMINDHRIMAYDPYEKPYSVRVISLPGVDIDAYGRSCMDFGGSLLEQHGGDLRFFVAELDGSPNELSGSLSVWVLNDYECGKWCLRHRVDIRMDGLMVSLFPAPLCFHPFDPNIVYMMNKQALFSYDFKTSELKTEVDYSSFGFSCPRYFLFVIPPWPVSINPSSLRSPPEFDFLLRKS